MTEVIDVRRDTSAQVAEAQSLLQSGQLAEAISLSRRLLAEEPQNRDALYTIAVAQRIQKQFDAASETCRTLIALDPASGRAYQELGHALRDMGDMPGALSAYQDAVARNNALLGSWQMLAQIHERAGREVPAEFANAQIEHLAALPPQLRSVASLIQEGRLYKAEQLCRHYLQNYGHHVEGMRLLAQIAGSFNVHDEAEFLLESAVVIDPANIAAHFDYVGTLQKRQKLSQALEQANFLRAKDPGNPQIEMLYANQSLAVGNFDEALRIYRGQSGRAPNNPGIHLTMGHALKTTGQQADAIVAYTRAYQLKPDFGDAYWSLANLKTYRFDTEQIAAMRAIEGAPTTQLADRYHLCFALGKALEDHGAYPDSFAYYDRGNRLKREEVGYDWRRVTREIDRQIEFTSAELFADKTGSGDVARDPIFVLGLPRAGSTLLEQILASHSLIEGTMELPNILALSHKLGGRRRIDEEPDYPANLGELSAADFSAFGEAFIADTAIHRKSGKPFFIDKMPNNFRHIGLIHLILPNAKIIDARRGARSCCFSGFKQLFAEGQEFTYGLQEVGHYYSDYVRLMTHWDTVLPGKVLRVTYEDVVADLEPQVRRMLDFLELPFEDACLNFHRTERAVRTASSEQVRQPIFKSGVDHWENFSPWLDPLRAVLGPELSAT